jgi:hypothetical protein
MSWIAGSSQFLVEQSPEENGKGRKYLYKNVGKYDGYWVGYDFSGILPFIYNHKNDSLQSEYPTSLRFQKWRVEFSDFVFDDPVVQELKPFIVGLRSSAKITNARGSYNPYCHRLTNTIHHRKIKSMHF